MIRHTKHDRGVLVITRSTAAYLLMLFSVLAQNPPSVQREQMAAKVEPNSRLATITHADGAASYVEGAPSTYYVSPSGSDENDGLTEANPFRTIQKAADSTDPGDTVLIMAGTYMAANAAVDVVKITRSGRPGRWITFRNFPGTRPLIFNERSWQGINVYGASYIIVDGLAVKGNSSIITQEMAEKASHLDSSTNGNCILAQNNENTYPHHIVFVNNIVYDCPGGGIGTTYADYVKIANNTVMHSALWSKWGNSGISIYESRDYDAAEGYKNIVANNVVCENEQRIKTKNNGKITDGNGIIIDDLNNTQSRFIPYAGKTLVESNILYRNGGRGIHIYRSSRVDVVNNKTYWNNKNLEGEGEITVVFSHDVNILGNVAYARTGRSAMHVYGNGAAIRIANNYLHDESVAPSLMSDLIETQLFFDELRRKFHEKFGSRDLVLGRDKVAFGDYYDGVAQPPGRWPEHGADPFVASPLKDGEFDRRRCEPDAVANR